MNLGDKYVVKLATARQEAVLEQIISVTNASTLDVKAGCVVEKNDIAECIFTIDRPIAFDLGSEIHETGRFVLVQDYEISGGGVITAALDSPNDHSQSTVRRRNAKWESGKITEQQRAVRYNQKPVLILLTGPAGDDSRKMVARQLERGLFNEGKFVYYMGMRNLIYGVDADIKDSNFAEVDSQSEHFRRFAEIAHIMLDAGMILIVTARDVEAHELEYFKTGFTGKENSIICERVALNDTGDENIENKVIELQQMLLNDGYVFNPFQ